MTNQKQQHARSTFKSPQRQNGKLVSGLGVIVWTMRIVDIGTHAITYSAYVNRGGTGQPRIVRNGRPNREAAIKSVLRAIDAQWIDHNAQDLVDAKALAKLDCVDLAQCHFESTMAQLVDEVVDRYSDLDLRECQESIDYDWRCDSSWADDCQLDDGNDDCDCDRCEDVSGFRAARLQPV